jgi:hypothetical protein
MQPTIHLEGKAGSTSNFTLIQLSAPNVLLWVAFSILSGSLLLVNHLVDAKKLKIFLLIDMKYLAVLIFLSFFILETTLVIPLKVLDGSIKVRISLGCYILVLLPSLFETSYYFYKSLKIMYKEISKNLYTSF